MHNEKLLPAALPALSHMSRPRIVLPVRRLCAALLVAGLLTSCATVAPPEGGVEAGADWVQSNRIDGSVVGWVHKTFANRRSTRYTTGWHNGRPALHARSDGSNSTLRLNLDPPVDPQARQLSFSWLVPALDPIAVASKEPVDDAVVRIILTFEGDRSQGWTARDHLLSELARLVTGEALPYATLIYVWDPRQPVGTVMPSPHTQRIRKLVVESGDQGLNRWLDYQRNIAADFQAVFGEAPGRLTGVGVMTDSNNTASRVSAWFGPIALTGAPTATSR